MRFLFSVLLLCLGPLCCLAKAQMWFPSSTPRIREIETTQIQDIAIAAMDVYGPVIYINPQAAAYAGYSFTQFTRAHEYGHHNLGHVVAIMNNPYGTAWLRPGMEFAADDSACSYFLGMGNTRLLWEVVNFFRTHPSPGDATHPPSWERANRIEAHIHQGF